MTSGPIEINDLKFMHERCRVRTLSALPVIQVCGETIGPLERGSELETPQWVAEELARNRLVVLIESQEQLGLMEFQRVQLRENIQTSRRLSNLPSNFYPHLRRYMSELKTEIDPKKIVEFQKAQKLVVDILTSRIYKILLIATATEESMVVTENLTPEETALHRNIHQAVADWKMSITKSWEPGT